MENAFNLVDNSGIDLQAFKQKQVQYNLQFEREKTALKYYLLGKGYHKAIRALGYIEQIEFRTPPEQRFRKDGVTPSLHHQVRIALAVTQLPFVLHEELCIIAALLHDVQEDYNISVEEICAHFGRRASEITWRMTKKFAGTHKNKEEYVRELSLCDVGSLVKGLDRQDNLCRMIGVFSNKKMLEYALEAETVFLKMLKYASKLFPEQLQAYNTIMIHMKQQIEFSRQYAIMDQERQDYLNGLDHLSELNSELQKESSSLQNQIDQYKVEIDQFKTEKNKSVNKTLKVIMKTLIASKKFSQEELIKELEKITISLGISVLELNEFTSDNLSDGTTIVRT